MRSSVFLLALAVASMFSGVTLLKASASDLRTLPGQRQFEKTAWDKFEHRDRMLSDLASKLIGMTHLKVHKLLGQPDIYLAPSASTCTPADNDRYAIRMYALSSPLELVPCLQVSYLNNSVVSVHQASCYARIPEGTRIPDQEKK